MTAITENREIPIRNPISSNEQLDLAIKSYERELAKGRDRNMELLISQVVAVTAWMAAINKSRCKTDELETNEKLHIVVTKIEDTWNGKTVKVLTWISAGSNIVAVGVGVATGNDSLVTAFSYLGNGVNGFITLKNNEKEGMRVILNFKQDALKNKAEGARGGKSESGQRLHELMQKLQELWSAIHQAFQGTASVGG